MATEAGSARTIAAAWILVTQVRTPREMRVGHSLAELGLDDRLRKACAAWFKHDERFRQPVAEFGDDVHNRLAAKRTSETARKADQDEAWGGVSTGIAGRPKSLSSVDSNLRPPA